MNNQEVLDKVANHLLKQGKKAKEYPREPRLARLPLWSPRLKTLRK